MAGEGVAMEALPALETLWEEAFHMAGFPFLVFVLCAILGWLLMPLHLGKWLLQLRRGEAAGDLLDPPLWTASSLGITEEVRWLLATGADIEAHGGREGGETSPLEEAIIRGHVPTVQLLLAEGASSGVLTLKFAAYSGSVEVAAQQLVSSRDGVGLTALHWAALCGQAEIVLLLLERGADVSSKTTPGWTPLHFAACCGREAMVQLLLDRGADETLRTLDCGRTTPEEMATAAQHLATAAVIKTEAERRAKCRAFASAAAA